MHEGTMRRSDERHFRCSCVVAVICARAFSFYPFLWCLKSLTQRKRKRMMMNTRGWTGGRPNFFLFFITFLLFLSKSAKRRESLFEQNENIFFNFHVREKKKKWGKSIESPKKKKHCTAALTILRECVCVYSSHLILINEKRRREN